MRRLRLLRRLLAFAVLLCVLVGACKRIKAVTSQRTFLTWARQAAIPMPASNEESMSDEARLILERMLEGKRFVFLGEPDHFFIEKYSFRLTFIQYLFANGWQHIAMENGQSVGWRVDQYLKTGDASYWYFDRPSKPHNPLDSATLGRISEFLRRYEYTSFPEQLREISESSDEGTSRLHYMGFDLDLGVPLGSIKPIKLLLDKHTHNPQIQKILGLLKMLTELSTDQQLAQVEAIQGELADQKDPLTKALG